MTAGLVLLFVIVNSQDTDAGYEAGFDSPAAIAEETKETDQREQNEKDGNGC